MGLGNLLLQPQRLQRETGGDPQLEVAQDLLRLLTLLAEDAADEGQLAGVMPQLLTRLGTRVQAQAEGGITAVYAALKARFHPLFLYFEGLVDEVGQLESSPTALIAIIRRIVAGLRSVVDSVSQAQIQAQLDFAKGLLEGQLGVDPQFVNSQIGALLDDLIDLWQRLPADISPKRRRRRRLAIRIIRRLRSHLLHGFTLPQIDTARAAGKLYRSLRSSGLGDIFDRSIGVRRDHRQLLRVGFLKPALFWKDINRNDLRFVAFAVGHALGNPTTDESILVRILCQALAASVRRRVDRFQQQQALIGC